MKIENLFSVHKTFISTSSRNVCCKCVSDHLDLIGGNSKSQTCSKYLSRLVHHHPHSCQHLLVQKEISYVYDASYKGLFNQTLVQLHFAPHPLPQKAYELMSQTAFGGSKE